MSGRAVPKTHGRGEKARQKMPENAREGERAKRGNETTKNAANMPMSFPAMWCARLQ